LGQYGKIQICRKWENCLKGLGPFYRIQKSRTAEEEGSALPPEREIEVKDLFEGNACKLLLYARLQLGDSDWAAETVHDVFYTVMNKPDILWRYGKPEASLMGVLKNKIREARRKRRRDLSMFLSLEEDVLPNSKTASGSSIPLSTDSILNEAKAALSDDEWRLLSRHVFEGVSHLELAKELGITVWASQKRLERIREKLKSVLPER